MAASLSSEGGSTGTSSKGDELVLETTGAEPHRAWCLYSSALFILVALGMLAFVITADAGGYATLGAFLLGMVGLGGSVVLAGLLAVCSIVRREPGRWLTVTIVIAEICLAVVVILSIYGF